MTLALPAAVTRRSYGLLFSIVLLDLVGFGIVLPLLPTHAAGFTSSGAAIGILVASFSLMQFLVAPWWGRLSDRIGRRPVLLAGIAASAVSYVMFALAGTYLVLLASRILAGGVGATVNVSQAYLADITPEERRTRAMGVIGVAFGMGFILGPAIAALSSRAGAAIPGFIAGGICLLSFVITWTSLPETRISPTPTPRPGPVNWRGFAAPFAVMFLSVAAFAVITVVFPLYAAAVLGFGRRETSMVFVLMGVCSAVVQGWLIGRLTPAVGERTLMLAGSVLIAAGLAAIPLSPALAGPWGLAVLLVAVSLVAAGSGFAWPGVAGHVSRAAAARDQGQLLGALHSVASLARVAGPVLAGLLSEQAGAAAAFFVAAGLAGAAGLSAAAVRGS